MADENPTPAVEAPQAIEALVNAETPAAAAPPEGTTEPAVKPEAPTTAEPDIEALLGNADFMQKLLAHKTVEQRVKSVREADIDKRAEEKATTKAAEIVRQERAKVEADAQARLQEATNEQRDLELWKEIENDPTSPLAQRLRPELQARFAARQAQAAKQAAMQELLPQVLPQLQKDMFQQAGQHWMTALEQAAAGAEGLTDEQRAEFNPRDSSKWTNLPEFFSALVQASAKGLAETEIRKRLPVEVEAKVQERMGQLRREEGTPTPMPAGAAGSDNEFIAAYSAGKSNDHARSLKLMKEMGLQI